MFNILTLLSCIDPKKVSLIAYWQLSKNKWKSHENATSAFIALHYFVNPLITNFIEIFNYIYPHLMHICKTKTLKSY